MIMRIPILKMILKSYTPSWQIMRSSALDRLPYLNFSHIRKVKDALGRCHDENGYLVSCTGGSGTGSSSTARGQATLSDFGQKPEKKPEARASRTPEGKPSEETPSQHDIKAERSRSGVKYSGKDSALYTSKDGQGDRVVSGIRFSKDPKATAALIERALKDGPFAIPNNIANSPNGQKALAELQKDGKISLNTSLKDEHTIVKPGDGKKPESKPESKPEPKPAPKQEAKPEPKPEPKPEQKPADGEVEVKRSGSFAAYRDL